MTPDPSWWNVMSNLFWLWCDERNSVCTEFCFVFWHSHFALSDVNFNAIAFHGSSEIFWNLLISATVNSRFVCKVEGERISFVSLFGKFALVLEHRFVRILYHKLLLWNALDHKSTFNFQLSIWIKGIISWWACVEFQVLMLNAHR